MARILVTTVAMSRNFPLSTRVIRSMQGPPSVDHGQIHKPPHRTLTSIPSTLPFRFVITLWCHHPSNHTTPFLQQSPCHIHNNLSTPHLGPQATTKHTRQAILLYPPPTSILHFTQTISILSLQPPANCKISVLPLRQL